MFVQSLVDHLSVKERFFHPPLGMTLESGPLALSTWPHPVGSQPMDFHRVRDANVHQGYHALRFPSSLWYHQHSLEWLGIFFQAGSSRGISIWKPGCRASRLVDKQTCICSFRVRLPSSASDRPFLYIVCSCYPRVKINCITTGNQYHMSYTGSWLALHSRATFWGGYSFSNAAAVFIWIQQGSHGCIPLQSFRLVVNSVWTCFGTRSGSNYSFHETPKTVLEVFLPRFTNEIRLNQVFFFGKHSISAKIMIYSNIQKKIYCSYEHIISGVATWGLREISMLSSSSASCRYPSFTSS